MNSATESNTARYTMPGADDESDAGNASASEELFYMLPEQMDETIRTWLTRENVERCFQNGSDFTEAERSAIIAFYEGNPNTGATFDEMKRRVMRWKLWQQFNGALLHPAVVFAVLNLVMDGSVEIRSPFNAAVRRYLVKELGYTEEDLSAKCRQSEQEDAHGE